MLATLAAAFVASIWVIIVANCAERVYTGVVMSDPGFPYDSRLTYENGRLILAEGHSVNLLRDLSVILKFKPKFLKATDWGQKLENGSWTGMPHQLQMDEADISASQSTFTQEKVKDFGILQPTFRGAYYAHFQKRQNVLYGDVFRQPFAVKVWHTLGITLIFTHLGYYCISLVLQKFEDGMNVGGDKLGFLETFSTIVSMISQHGIGFKPKSLPLRIITISSSLSFAILYIAYSAELIAKFKAGLPPVKDFRELVARYHLVGDATIPFIKDIVRVHRTGEDNETNIPKVDFDFYLNKESAINEVLRGDTAFLTVEGFYLTFLAANKSIQEYCENIVTMTALQTLRWCGMSVRKKWNEKESFGKGVIKIMENGLNYRYEKQSRRIFNPSCSWEQKHDDGLKIGIENVLVVFILLTGCASLSLVIFFLEFIYSSVDLAWNRRRFRMTYTFLK